MAYTKEQIEEYTEIFLKYKKQLEEPLLKEKKNYTACVNPDCITNQQEDQQGGLEFYIESGFYMCESCDSSNGHALGYYDLKEYDRFHYRKKSIYQRKYHYENKVKDISKRLALTDDEQYCLYNKLMEIEEKIIDEINKHFNRKRMISVFYLIKKLLEEMGCEKYKQIGLRLSKETFANYEKWWKYYKNGLHKPAAGEYYKNEFKEIKVLINNHAREKV